MNDWTLNEAVELAKKVEDICPTYGYHVALTGGLLYKSGARKDCDLVLYRAGGGYANRTNLVKALTDMLFADLAPATKKATTTDVRVFKGSYRGMAVDLIFPEFPGGAGSSGGG